MHLLFQPAEETGTGAAAVLNDPAFDPFTPDFAVAIRNMPDFPDELIATGVELVEQIVRDAEGNFEPTLRSHLS